MIDRDDYHYYQQELKAMENAHSVERVIVLLAFVFIVGGVVIGSWLNCN